MFAARAMQFTTAAAPPPTISVIADWQLTAGETITVQGTNFVAGATTVKFNATNGTSVNVASPTTLTVTVPNLGSAQQVSVTVTTPGGTSNAYSNPVFYGVPSYSGVSASAGKTGDSITVYGSNFTGSGSPSATVGGVAATITNVGGNSQFTVTVPSISSSGPKTITYTNPGGTMTASNVFSYTAAPTVGSVSPSSVSAGQTITITGSNFITGATTVTVNGVAATSVSVSGGTSLTCVVPNASGYSALVTVAVTTAGGTASTTTNYVAPSISGVSPPQGKAGTVLAVTGAGFAGSVSATVGGVAASVTVNSATSLSVTVPTLSGEGAKDVVVTPAGGAVTAASAFTYYNARTAVGTTYTAVGSGSYTIPAWASFVDCIAVGGGQGGGRGEIFNTGLGGNAGVWSGVTFDRSTNWGTTTLAYTVGGGGGQSGVSAAPGSEGTASSAGSATGAGGSGDSGQLNGKSPGTFTFAGVTYTGGSGGAAPTGASSAPGGGGVGGSIGLGLGGVGAAGRVWFVARQ